LQGLASTGTGAGLTLGEGYSGDLGYYHRTPGETRAVEGLWGLASGDALNTAESTFKNLANLEFNPDDPSSGYASFSRALAKAGKESSDALNREAAITGSRYSTNIGRQKADLSADLANQRGMFLADLYKGQQQLALRGAEGMQNIALSRAGLFQDIANQEAITRMLKDKQAKDRYAEFERQRGEELSRIDLMKDQFDNPLGSYEIKEQTMLGKLMPSLAGALGTAFLGPIGGAIGGGLVSMFTGGNGGGAPMGGNAGAQIGTGLMQNLFMPRKGQPRYMSLD
jgi:hypothetical protein